MAEADDEDAISAAFARKLMNTERFFISTGPEGGIISALHERTLDRPTLLVRADSAGMRRSSDSRYDGSVDYVIIAELLVGGVVPAGAIRFIAVSIIAIVLLVPTLSAIILCLIRKEEALNIKRHTS